MCIQQIFTYVAFQDDLPWYLLASCNLCRLQPVSTKNMVSLFPKSRKSEKENVAMYLKVCRYLFYLFLEYLESFHFGPFRSRRSKWTEDNSILRLFEDEEDTLRGIFYIDVSCTCMQKS